MIGGNEIKVEHYEPKPGTSGQPNLFGSQCLVLRLKEELIFGGNKPGAGNAVLEIVDSEDHPRNADSEFNVKTMMCRLCGGCAIMFMREDGSVESIRNPEVLDSIEETCTELREL